jgi:cob(I)alamin adenosyltransferase
MAKLYTRQGDEGMTQLLGGKRVRKDHPQVEAYGTVDELTAAIGLAAAWAPPSLGEQLVWIQEMLFAIGAILAQGDLASKGRWKLEKQSATQLEAWIDALSGELPEQTAFLLPGPVGGPPGAAQLHVARTICRRAERRVCALGEELGDVLPFLNRLADYLYGAARWLSWHEGTGDHPVRITGLSKEDA